MITKKDRERASQLSKMVSAIGKPKTEKPRASGLYFGLPETVKPTKGVDYLTPEEIATIKQEIIAELSMADVSEIMAKKVVAAMKKLPEQDRLEVQDIRNHQAFIFKGTKYGMHEMMHGGANASTANGTTYYTPSGAVDASNTVFGVTDTPTSVIADGTIYFSGVGYTYNAGLLQITMDIAPSQYIRYTL